MAATARARRRKRKKITAIIVAAILVLVIAAGVVFVPRLIHRCDNCGKTFVGTGYYPNVVTSTIAGLTQQEEKILCGDCAKDEHALALATGKSIEEFKRPLFGEAEEDLAK